MHTHTLLIVDDDPVNRLVLQGLLKSSYDLYQAQNGIEAVAMSKQHNIDLILMDIMMPRMSGYDATREIRKEYDKDTLPVIFVTAKRAEAELDNFKEVGGNAILLKPLDKTTLLNSIVQHLPEDKKAD